MTTPITLHAAGDESNHPDIPYREIVGLHGIESVVPSSGAWINTTPHTNKEEPHNTFPDKQPQIHKEGAD